MAYLIPDDPIVSSMMRTGYPPWLAGFGDDEDEEVNGDESDED